MKYTIKEIEKSKTITKFTLKEKYIEVNYLDGTTDIFDRTMENLTIIVNIMNMQARKYVEGFAFKKNKLKNKIKSSKIILIASVIALIIIGIMTYLAAETLEILPILVEILGFGLISFYNFTSLLKSDKKLKDLEKYHLFIKEVQDKIKDYDKIITKEKYLTNSTTKQPETIHINNLDKHSLQELKKILLKIERYSTIANMQELNVDQNESAQKTLSKNINKKDK